MISAESIVTQEMEVDAEFIHKAMELGSLKAYLEGCSGAPPALYIVTGLKIVYGASAQSETKSDMEASFGAQVLGQETAKGASMMDGGDATASHELEVIGIGEDVTPEPEAVEYEEVILQKDQEADTDWIVPEV
ncbi:hypothetical protein CPLU01_12634 [Colletotrichum plurivorum]|uniref:Uncharacterized protein n=1 Tax=Colletotrichum plurivorum TaxID=2175906 RepID=A0A8H6JYD4_9PEZI|nr:hypothetical protein CPLU01_12634 [Colletotrichum plurivorum]